MAEFDMVNGILLTGNLVIWVALCPVSYTHLTLPTIYSV